MKLVYSVLAFAVSVLASYFYTYRNRVTDNNQPDEQKKHFCGEDFKIIVDGFFKYRHYYLVDIRDKKQYRLIMFRKPRIHEEFDLFYNKDNSSTKIYYYRMCDTIGDRILLILGYTGTIITIAGSVLYALNRISSAIFLLCVMIFLFTAASVFTGRNRKVSATDMFYTIISVMLAVILIIILIHIVVYNYPILV